MFHTEPLVNSEGQLDEAALRRLAEHASRQRYLDAGAITHQGPFGTQQYIASSAAVTSINGQTGDVILAASLTVTTVDPGTGDATASYAGLTTVDVDLASGLAFSGTTLSVQAASVTHAGMVTTTLQEFAGIKEFQDTVYAFDLLKTNEIDFNTAAGGGYGSTYGASITATAEPEHGNDALKAWVPTTALFLTASDGTHNYGLLLQDSGNPAQPHCGYGIELQGVVTWGATGTGGGGDTFIGGICTALGAGGGGLTVSTTTISGGTSGKILYDNGGVLGEESLSSVAVTSLNGQQGGVSLVSAGGILTTSTGGTITLTGGTLGFNYAGTDESTTSTTYVDLATPDSVTFSLPTGGGNVLVEYIFTTYGNTSPTTTSSEIYLDGVAQAGSANNYYNPTANVGQTTAIVYRLTGLAAGSHTVNVKHSTQAGTTGHWIYRSLKVSVCP